MKGQPAHRRTDACGYFLENRPAHRAANNPRRLSLDVPRYSETLFITDAAINIFPDLDVKRDIVQNAIDLFTKTGLGTPRVAILSAVETVTSKIPSTIEAAALCKMADRGCESPGGDLDGPLTFEQCRSIPKAARIPDIQSAVAGRGANPGGAGSRGRQHARQEPRPAVRRRTRRASCSRRTRPPSCSPRARIRCAAAWPSCALAVLYADARRGPTAPPVG